MEREMRNLFKVWGLAIASACYSYCLSSSRIFHIPSGIPRLIFILPVVYLFTVLPLSLSSFHLGGPTIFYLVWLGNFKLLLYSFDLGPLSTSTSLLHFVSIALLPIKLKDDEPNRGKLLGQPKLGKSVLFAVKLLAFAIVVKAYDYGQNLPRFVILANYCCHMYLGVEITLAASATLVRATLGLDLDPQFNEPYLATSLQDFWGRRWNLMVSDILRLAVYGPIRRFASPLMGRRWALVAGMLAAFTVSGLMHEVIFFYFTRVTPTWEVTWFFILQGACTAFEVAAKEAAAGKFRLHRAISGPLTIGFVGVTGAWLFLPQILRNGVDTKVIREYPIMIRFFKENILHV